MLSTSLHLWFCVSISRIMIRFQLWCVPVPLTSFGCSTIVNVSLSLVQTSRVYTLNKIIYRQPSSRFLACTVVVSTLPPLLGPVASQPVCSPDPLLPDQRCLPGHRHCRQVHWCWCCHSGCGRLRSWNWNSVRQPYHWLCQVEFFIWIYCGDSSPFTDGAIICFRTVFINLRVSKTNHPPEMD